MMAMIYELNKVFIWLAGREQFKNVYHIDCRGIAEGNIENWFDELHLKSDKFSKIAAAYKFAIDNLTDNNNKGRINKVLIAAQPDRWWKNNS
ncbi:MAG: hypothetical protein ABI528_04285 [bacterium]